jgi:membrane protein YqaA with SNARE-associated domain
MIRLAGAKHAEKALAVFSFAEASFFPIPPDVMLAPMVLARPDRAWRSALICAASSILGGCLGYYIGYALEPVGIWILHNLAHSDKSIAEYREFFGRWGFFIILGQGLIPIPYKLTTIATGLAHFPLWQFILASCITRTSRFMLVAFLFKRFGPEIGVLIEKRIKLVAAIVIAVLVLIFIAVKFLAKGH